MFTATVAYLFLWIGGTALVLLACRRDERPLPLGMALGFGWGIGVLVAGLVEPLAGFERLPVRLASAIALGVPILASARRRLWSAPTAWDLAMGTLIVLSTAGLWAEAGSNHVAGDAVHNWFLKAKVLVTDGTPMGYFGSASLASHPSYPPLHPLSVAWVAHVRGAWSDAAASLSGVFTVAATAVMLGVYLARTRGRLAAAAGVLALLGLPFAQAASVKGDADLLLAYFALAGVLALLHLGEGRSERSWLVLAAAMSAGAALTKSEGVVVTVALSAAAAATLAGPIRRRLWGALAMAASGLAAAAIWHLVRNLALAPMPLEAGGVQPAAVLSFFSRLDLLLDRVRIGVLTIAGGMGSATWGASFWVVVGVVLAWPRRWCRTTRALAVAAIFVVVSLVVAYAVNRISASLVSAQALPRNLLVVYPLAVMVVIVRLAPNRTAVPGGVGEITRARRWTGGAVAGAALMLVAAAPLTPAASRLTNGGVEGGASWSRPGGAVRIERAGARRGLAGLTIDAGVSPGALTVNRSIAARAGETLRLRYWARGSPDAIYRVYVEWGSAATGQVAGPGAGAAGTDYWYWGGSQWEQHEIVWTMPPGSHSRPYVVAQAMRGEASFDDFSVTAAPSLHTLVGRWWLVGAIVIGLALTGRVASVNLALVAFAAWASVMAWQTLARQAPKLWGSWPAELTRDLGRAPDRHRYLGLAAHAQHVRPWLDPTLPLAVRTSERDFRHATTLQYLLYGHYLAGPAAPDGRCNVLTFRRGVGTDAPLPDAELALMPPRNAVRRATVALGDVYVAQGDCESGPVARLSRRAPPPR